MTDFSLTSVNKQFYICKFEVIRDRRTAQIAGQI